MNAAPAAAQAARILATRQLNDRELGVAIARAVHPTMSYTQLGTVCRMTKSMYARTWYGLTSQHNPPTPEGVTP